MKSSRSLLKILDPVLEAARSVLRDLEPAEVPAGLHKVAKVSGGRALTPPYARRLFAELVDNQWLRDKVTDVMIKADPASDDHQMSAAGLFLHRPDDWESRLDGIVAEHEETEQGTNIAALQQELARAKSTLSTAKERERRAKAAIEDAQKEADRRVKEAKSTLEAVRSAAAAPTNELRRELEDSRAEVDRLKTALVEADGRILSLKNTLLKERRTVRDSGEYGEPTVWRSGDPLDLAKMLDAVMVARRPDTIDPDRRGDSHVDLTIPEGIRPDQVDAVHWMLAQERPVTLVVDGYNVSHKLDPSLARTPALRDQVRDGLIRLKRLATGPLPIVLVFDSGEEPSTIPGRVEVRFVHNADDEIVRLAAAMPGDVIVVSTDREVRERAEHNGAIALWSDALVAWMRKP